MRQLTDETHRVRKQEWQVAQHHLPHCGVKSGKELVFRKQVSLADLVHQGRFPDVGITDKGNPDHFFPPLAAGVHLGVDLLELLLELRDLVTDDTAVGLNLSLTRSSQSDTSPLPFEVSPHAGESREKVLVLSQLHLGSGMRGTGPSRKNVKYEVGAVDDAAVEILFNIAYLAWGELIVKDCECDLTGSNKGSYLLYLPLVDKGSWIGMFNALQELPDRHGSGRLCQERKLVKVIAGAGLADLRGDDPYQYRSFYFSEGYSVSIIPCSSGLCSR